MEPRIETEASPLFGPPAAPTWRRLAWSLLALGVAAAATLGCGPAGEPAAVQGVTSSPSSPAQADVQSKVKGETREVLDWNDFASNLVAAQLPPGPQTYVLAVTQLAVHDALNAIDPKYEPYAHAGSAPGASAEAAVAAAARDCLVRLVAQAAAAIEAQYAAALEALPDSGARAAGIAAGQAAAAAILDRRRADDLQEAITRPYTPGAPAPGVYQPTPPLGLVLLAGWGDLPPFALERADQFRPPPPLAVKSFRYAAEYAEVKALGSARSGARSERQTETAHFWYDVATREWHAAARQVLAAERADAWRSARTLALLAVAMADVGIASFEAKYEYQFWRPITAIRAGDHDGNRFTAGEAGWEPLCVTPPFPEHDSTHAATGAAAAGILERELGDRHTFTVESPTLPGAIRTYRRFSAAAHEEALSRVYCGIHFRRAMDAGLVHGARVARNVERHLLRERW